MRQRVDIFNKPLRSQKRTAFDWQAYLNRRDGLKLLRANKILVDTLVSTEDGFSDTVHWQVITALCPKLIEASKTNQKKTTGRFQWRHLMFPSRITSQLARQLLECAYGEDISLDRSNMHEFYSISVEYSISYAIKVCLNYAKSLLNVHNCIQMLLLSLKHRHHSLRRASYSLIRSNFKLVLHVNRDFHLLHSDYLKNLFLDDLLKLNEDEEFVWLAIVRWIDGRVISQTEYMSIYSQMIAPPPQSPDSSDWLTQQQQQQQVSMSAKSIAVRYRARNISHPQQQQHYQDQVVSFYSPPIPFDNTLNEFSHHRQEPELFSALEMEKSENTVGLRDENQLIDLVKCLRFMLFRSVNAFNVILSNEHVQNSQKLLLLVNHMKLRYVIRKKLPFDENQLQLILPKNLDEIRLSETTRPKRLLKSVVKFVKCRQLTNPRSLQQQQPGTILNDNLTIEDQGQSESAAPDKLLKQPLKLTVTTLDHLGENCLSRASKPRVPNSVALLIGGWHEGAVSKSLLAYDFVCNQWFKLTVKLPEPRAFHASCSSPKTGQIFIFGGTNGNEILDSVLRFNPAQDVIHSSSSTKATTCCKTYNKRCEKCRNRSKLTYKFHTMCHMRERRCHLSGVFHSDGKLYALGGHNGQQRLKSGEWFDSNSNQWHPIADMTIARSDASACSHENKIFIAGGQISDQLIQSSVEFYKANDNTWTFATPMIVPRMSFRLVSFKSHLLAIGGTNGLMGGDEIGSVTRSVERYNTNLSSWSLCAPMNQKRSSFGVMNIENNLIVVGGYGGRRRLKTSESLKIGHYTVPVNLHHHHQQQYATQRAQVQTTTEVDARSLFGLNEPPASSLRPMATTHPTSEPFGIRGPPPIRSAMKWVEKANLPSKRSGFSICVVNQLRNAKEFTYHGSLDQTNKATVIKQKGRWHKFKIIKRRKLVKHLKIALVVTLVILIM